MDVQLTTPLLDEPEVIGGLVREPDSALLPNAISRRTAISGLACGHLHALLQAIAELSDGDAVISGLADLGAGLARNCPGACMARVALCRRGCVSAEAAKGSTFRGGPAGRRPVFHQGRPPMVAAHAGVGIPVMVERSPGAPRRLDSMY